ncbi:hypothetical protein [Bradyrhizobium sp. URHD0069]|uniref:hypothetical protein n=1 Tax=Bradyrhizobium sp. URHD0069 TaxID=1380355 RepID=UPI000B0D952A|nr:hypothetical protein [Bradyrhizobium sp. URHD0069]
MAILNVLARCPGGRATLDDVRREVGIIIASGDQTDQLTRFSELGDIDIFQSGLVLRDDAGLQITDAGLTLLHSLEGSSGPFLEVSSVPASPPFDNPISMEERLKIFDHELKMPGNDAQDGDHDNHHQPAQHEENRSVAMEAPDAASEIGAVDLPESTDSKGRERGRTSLKLASLVAFISAKKQFIFDIWRRHLTRETSLGSNRKNEHLIRNVGGAAFALLSVVVVVACVLAAISFAQIQSLKSDIAALRRELLPIKERVARVEQAEKEKRDLDQQEEPQDKPDTEKNKPGGEIRTGETALNLSREEIQLIRDYIKPAPSAGTAAPAINVGDSVEGAMIPLPSQLTEKLPRLLGAKFMTRNGAIIIAKRDSRQADAVLAPN